MSKKTPFLDCTRYLSESNKRTSWKTLVCRQVDSEKIFYRIPWLQTHTHLNRTDRQTISNRRHKLSTFRELTFRLHRRRADTEEVPRHCSQNREQRGILRPPLESVTFGLDGASQISIDLVSFNRTRQSLEEPTSRRRTCFRSFVGNTS